MATSPIASRLPRALAGTRKKQRAIGLSHVSLMFRYRDPPIRTLQRIDPGTGANSTRATSSNIRAACGGRGVAERTSIRTSAPAPVAADASVAAARSAAPSAASRLIMHPGYALSLPKSTTGEPVERQPPGIVGCGGGAGIDV